MKDNIWTVRCTEWQVRNGKRSRGRLRRRWHDDIQHLQGATCLVKREMDVTTVERVSGGIIHTLTQPWYKVQVRTFWSTVCNVT